MRVGPPGHQHWQLQRRQLPSLTAKVKRLVNEQALATVSGAVTGGISLVSLPRKWLATRLTDQSINAFPFSVLFVERADQPVSAFPFFHLFSVLFPQRAFPFCPVQALPPSTKLSVALEINQSTKLCLFHCLGFADFYGEIACLTTSCLFKGTRLLIKEVALGNKSS